jgi:hypothetical protein
MKRGRQNHLWFETLRNAIHDKVMTSGPNDSRDVVRKWPSGRVALQRKGRMSERMLTSRFSRRTSENTQRVGLCANLASLTNDQPDFCHDDSTHPLGWRVCRDGL